MDNFREFMIDNTVDDLKRFGLVGSVMLMDNDNMASVNVSCGRKYEIKKSNGKVFVRDKYGNLFAVAIDKFRLFISCLKSFVLSSSDNFDKRIYDYTTMESLVLEVDYFD